MTRPAGLPVCHLADLADGRSRGLDPLHEGCDTMFAVRRGEHLYAYRNACPHYDMARMAWKRHEFLNGDRSRIMCAAHGALFTIETGQCEIGPCLGQALTPVRLILRDGAAWLRDPYAPGRRRAAGRAPSDPTS